MKTYSGWILTALLATTWMTLGTTTHAADPEIRLKGATTLAKMIKAQSEKLESSLGLKLNVTGNGSGRGMLDLNNGDADIGMIGGPLNGVVDETNKQNPKANLVLADFQATQVSSVPLNIIVNPKNNVTTISNEQFINIMTGKFKNWKEVGGDDLPIIVVLPPLGDGARTYIKYDLLKDQDFTKDSRPVTLSPDAVKIVAQAPGGIAFVSPFHTNDTVKAVTTDKPLIMILSLVTKGNPTSTQSKVINAIKEAIQK